MALIDTTSTFGIILMQLNVITGSTFLSLLFVLLALFATCIGLRLPLELVGIIILPFIIVAIMVSGDFMGPLAVVVIFLAAIIAKYFFFN